MPLSLPKLIPRNLIWRVATGFLLVLLVVCVAFAVTFLPGTLVLPSVVIETRPTASPPASMTLSALPTGSYDSPAVLTYQGGAWGETRHLVATAVIIRHPKGNLLIDTGFGRTVEEQMKLLPSLQKSPHRKETAAVDRLAAGGIEPSDVAAIIPTHAHWDHISGVQDFAGTSVLETDAGMTFIASKRAGTEVINSFKAVNYRRYAFEGGPYQGFPRSHDMFGDGAVVIVPAPGHTPDSVVVFVTLPSGAQYAFIGDLVFQKEGIDIPAEKPWMIRRLIGESGAEIDLDIARIRAATRQNPQLQVVPAHDLSTFAAIPVFPASIN